MNLEAVRRRLFANSLLLGLSQLLSTATSLITVPIILNKLGVGGYGGWEAMMALAALLTVFQSVLGGTLVWKMSAAYGSGDLSEIGRLAGTGLRVVLWAFVAISPVIWMLRFKLVELSAIPRAYTDTAVVVLPCLVAQTLIGGIGDTFGAVLVAHQRAGLSTLIQTGASIANSGIVVFGLMQGWSIWSLLLGNTLGVVTSNLGLYLGARAVYGGNFVRADLPNWTEMRPLLSYAGFLALGQVSIALRDQTDRVVLASVGSAVWTAWFGLAARLANLVLLVCSFFYVPLISAAGALSAARDWDAVRRLYSNTMLVIPLVAGSCVVAVASSYDRLLVMWVGRRIPQVGPILFVLLAGNVVAVVLTGAGTALCKGIGKVKIEAAYVAICVVCNVALKFVLVRLLGPIGTVVSSATSWAVGSIAFVMLLHRAVNLPLASFRASAMLLLMGIATLVSRVLANLIPPSTSRWGAALAASAIGTFSILIYLTLLVTTYVVPPALIRSAGLSCCAAIRPRLKFIYGC